MRKEAPDIRVSMAVGEDRGKGGAATRCSCRTDFVPGADEWDAQVDRLEDMG